MHDYGLVNIVKEGRCECIKQSVSDSWHGVVLQPWSWARGWQPHGLRWALVNTVMKLRNLT